MSPKVDTYLLRATNIGLSDASIALIEARSKGIWYEALGIDVESQNPPTAVVEGVELIEAKEGTGTNMENAKRYGVCTNCGGVYTMHTGDCPSCHTYGDMTFVSNINTYFTDLAKQAGIAVLYEHSDGEHWIFTPEGEAIAAGDVPDDVMYYEER